MPVNSQGEIFVETRAQDVDLPLRFTVRYNDAERDGDIATQTAKRIAAPTATMHSANEATLDLPLTLTPAQAKEVALRQCFGPWAERTGHQWKLDWTHLDLDPGDVVTVALNSGRSYVVRLLEMGIGADLSIELQTVDRGERLVRRHGGHQPAAWYSAGRSPRRPPPRAWCSPTCRC